MKNTIIMSILLFVLMFQLTSCKEDSKSQNKDIKTKTETKAVFDTIFDRKNPYYAFIKKNHPKALNDEVSFFQESDLDLDGKDEVILAFERDSDAGPFIQNLFILKKEDGIIKEIKSNFGNYTFDNIQLISLKGKDKPCIMLEIFEGPSELGFAIYEMIDNQIKQTFLSASVGLNYIEYYDSLIDSKKDGYYDKYIQDIVYSDFKLEKEYVFENELFVLKNKHYILNKYPDTERWVVMQYMSIKSLDFYDNTINKRLQQISLHNSNELLSKANWDLAFKSALQDVEALKIDEQSEFGTTITVDFTDSKKNIEYKLQFELEETSESSGKWQITNVSLNN